MSVVVRLLVAALLALHGLIHALGFTATWHIGSAGAVAPTPNLITGITDGSGAAKTLGLLWLLPLAGFVVAAAGLAWGTSWWKVLAAASAVVSVALCIAWFNDAKFGLVIDIVILLALIAMALAGRSAAA